VVVCTGSGDRDGGHCCWIEGKVCKYLDESGEIPRCKLWGRMQGPRWERSLVGQWFAKNHPGFTCEDWPQNIPEAMAEGRGLCCWNPPVQVEIT